MSGLHDCLHGKSCFHHGDPSGFTTLVTLDNCEAGAGQSAVVSCLFFCPRDGFFEINPRSLL